MLIDDLLGHHQTDAGAIGALGTEKTLKDPPVRLFIQDHVLDRAPL